MKKRRKHLTRDDIACIMAVTGVLVIIFFKECWFRLLGKNK